MSQAPIFQDIFGAPWGQLPAVLQQRYGARADSLDRVVVSGVLNIRQSRFVGLIAPLLKFFGALAPFDGRDVPVTVAFSSGPGVNAVHYDRVFHFKGRPPFPFHSRFEQVSGGEVVEYMRFGLGWRALYGVEGARVTLSHRGYVWRIGKALIPLPLAWVLGKGAAAEEALSEDTFKMWMTITHPIFGENYHYEGEFRVIEATRG